MAADSRSSAYGSRGCLQPQSPSSKETLSSEPAAGASGDAWISGRARTLPLLHRAVLHCMHADADAGRVSTVAAGRRVFAWCIVVVLLRYSVWKYHHLTSLQRAETQHVAVVGGFMWRRPGTSARL